MYWDSTSTPVPGWSRRSSIAARSPSSVCVGGIRMSATATSGSVPGHGGEQRVRVADGGDHLVAAVGQQPGQALAEQGGVLGDHHAQRRRGARGAAAAVVAVMRASAA